MIEMCFLCVRACACVRVQVCVNRCMHAFMYECMHLQVACPCHGHAKKNLVVRGAAAGNRSLDQALHL